MKKKKLLSLLLFGLLLSIRTAAQTPVAYISNTNVDFKNRLIFGELVYDAPDLCGRYELRLKTKVLRSGMWIDSARVRPVSSAIISNINRYTLVGDSAITNLTASGYKLRINLISGVLPTDSVALTVEVYKKADECIGCGVGKSNLTFTKKDIWADCPFPNKENDPTLLSCNRTATGAAQHWEAFVRDSRDCKIYRIVHFERSNQWWLAQNLDWRMAGKCYPTASSCDTSGTLYSWYEAVTGQKDVATVFNYPQIMNDNTGPQGVCPEGWHLPTDVEWNRMGNAVGSGSDGEITWATGTQQQLMSFKDGATGWYQRGSMRNMDDRYGFDWQASFFDGAKGVNNNPAVKFGAFWSAVSTLVDPTVDPITRVVGMSVKGAWASNPLTSDSSHGSKGGDYLPVRCVLGEGNAPVVVNVPTPVFSVSSVCSGDTVVRVTNAPAFSQYIYEVNGVTYSRNTSFLELSHGKITSDSVVNVRVRGADAAGYWSRWAAVKNATVYANPTVSLSAVANACAGTTAKATATSIMSVAATSMTYAWGDAAQGIAGNNYVTADTMLQTMANSGSNIWYVKAKDSRGCVSLQQSTSVSTWTLPTTTLSALVVSGGTVTRAISASGGSGSGYTYASSIGAGVVPSTFSSNTLVNGSVAIRTTSGVAANYNYGVMNAAVKDSRGCVSPTITTAAGVYSMPAIPASVTFCNTCGYDGTTWVDAWITDNNQSVSYPINACQTTVFGASSFDNGRSNTNTILSACPSATVSSAKTCRNLGASYYLMSVGEGLRLAAASFLTNATADGGYHTSTETLAGSYCDCASYTAANSFCEVNTHFRSAANLQRNCLATKPKAENGGYIKCLWRP